MDNHGRPPLASRRGAGGRARRDTPTPSLTLTTPQLLLLCTAALLNLSRGLKLLQSQRSMYFVNSCVSIYV